ncbi:hypothetical protein M569_01505, partial [Genlisea aurea]
YSHTYRHELSFSRNGSWEKQNSPPSLHRILGSDEASTDSIPQQMKISVGLSSGGGADFLKEVSLHDVRLDPNSIYGLAQQTNLEYLLMLDVDKLVWSFRKTAGLDTPSEPYGGWENPNGELRGHFVGHYLSASAKMWASTHNARLYSRMSSLVLALSECQTKIGSGYLSAFPSELFDRFESLEAVWAPYYTIHKILAGLLDQYTLAANSHALNMVISMVEYFYMRVQNVIARYTIERHWLSLNEETGGMNDVLYRLYTITGNQKHFALALLFDKPCFLGLLALKADDISGFHANTHIPIVIGTQVRYEITGDPLFKEIGSFFMSIVNSSHSYATGGTSAGEFWSDPQRLGTTLGTENQESCTTYNMLKVSRHLFRWSKEMAYADYYERALINGVLGIQRGREPGVMIYMLPLRPGGSKARSYHGWGTQFNSFWCCYGTGIESFSKLGDSIYFEDVGKELALYVTQYISSSIDWNSGQILIMQLVEPAVSWDQSLKVKMKISTKTVSAPPSSTLKLRIPTWTSRNGPRASLNGADLSLPPPGNFLSITRIWRQGDEISLDLPLTLRTEAIKDNRPEYGSVQAVFYGPYLLAGLSSGGDWDIKLPDGDASSIAELLSPVPADYNSHLITLTQEVNGSVSALSTASDRSSVVMAAYRPEAGTDSAVAATFRLVAGVDSRRIMLEPIDFPGAVLSHQGEGESLTVSDAASAAAIFRLVPGIDGRGDGSVSLESESRRGCFVSRRGSSNVTLTCGGGGTVDREAASFGVRNGSSEYHVVSFVARGVKRNFLLVPLFSLRDESYTVYFNV